MQTQTGFAPINGTQIYYETAGTGQSMILIHAGVADSRMWDEQFATFAGQYRVVRYDLRGFGRSAMVSGQFSHHDDVAGLLDFLQLERAIVVAISFGGKIALDFALAYPQRVTALALGAPSISGVAPSARIQQIWEEEDAAIEREEWETAVELNLKVWVDGIHRQPDEVDTAVRQKVGQMQREIFQMEIPENVEELRLEPAANDRLAEITAPTLVLVGDLDLPEKVEQAAWLAQQIRNAQNAVIPGVAHMLNMEKPALFNQLVLDFLQGIDDKVTEKSLAELDSELANRFGDYAGFETAVAPIRDFYGENPNKEFKRLLKGYLKPDSCILDLGCGAGQTICQIASQVREVWGFEQEPALLAGAKRRAADFGLENVTFIEGNAAVPEDVEQLPDNHFDLIFTERGPDVNDNLITKLKSGGYYLQELVSQYDGFHLREFLGRRPFTSYAFRNQADLMLASLANLDVRPVSFREFYYDAFFRDLTHLEDYLQQVPAALSNWRLGPKPYQPNQDRAALELFAQYNQTSRGIRVLQHSIIFIGRKEPVHFYPVENIERRLS
jgi:3-oxoadipate enol-lactonase